MEQNEGLAQRLTREFSVKEQYAENVVRLIDEGNTIPFIARYRKELTGSMDDQVLRELGERLSYLRSLDKRKEEVTRAIDEQGKLTDELAAAIAGAQTMAEVEDIYRPYKQKRRTRATVARERGLAPLAELILKQDMRTGSVLDMAAPYVDEEKGVPSPEDAIAGAQDIIAEDMSDDAAVRKSLRELFRREGALVSRAADPGKESVYSMYYEYAEPLKKIPGHRVLAINRGEREELLKTGVDLAEGEAFGILESSFVREGSITTPLVREGARDAYKRLIFPSVEREMRGELTEGANEQAMKLFSLNLRHLLMGPPVRGRVTLGLDPAYRTGCKVAVVDGTGRVLDTTVVYPTPPQDKIEEAARTLRALIDRHGVTVIAIGNGTASKEAEVFAASLTREYGGALSYMVVNEAGASVYSASKLAAEEFPEYDVSLRSAVSIARRLQDPLAELVKIDPKSIGVGQYQHDMPPARLGESLDGVVEDCVNAVGADLNTASAPLLSRVAGVGPALAKNIVAHREKNGPFRDRRALLKVPKLGARAFEQCAGFLRVPGSPEELDNTAVHPESYDGARTLLKTAGCTPGEAAAGGTLLDACVKDQGEGALAQMCGIGVPTLRDIIAELKKPGRDPRDELPPPLLRTDVMDLKDLVPGMELTGTVRNVIDFGAFVDIGVHQDGLVHVSQIADRYIRHPSEVLKVGDVVNVRVLNVDPAKKRISLTMKKGAQQR